jgi:hypothetical protein
MNDRWKILKIGKKCRGAGKTVCRFFQAVVLCRVRKSWDFQPELLKGTEKPNCRMGLKGLIKE